MKEPYRWNYNIKIKTKDGEYTFEKAPLDSIGDLIDQFPDYVGMEARHIEEKEEKGKQLVKQKKPMGR